MTPAWTPVPKPTESSILVLSLDAEPFGLLMAITSVLGANSSSVITGWTDVPKPVSSIWSVIAKPTT